MLALLIDAVLQLVLFLLLGGAGDGGARPAGRRPPPALAGGLQVVLLVLVLLGYPVVMERFADGRTVGKLVVGLRVGGRPRRRAGGPTCPTSSSRWNWPGAPG
ncbi:RDD family protein [Micromonospora sp. b486]|uniref:RDD family protein n=1 Tax=Micromonospora sp. b486 TaxID=3053986 RepID=UPI00259CC4F4|nr:RDD family protein [Micromonospora sp. b486]MDM4784559.1 RDD family protein [Micromonospora sp. b486]